jgi:hypothetical protein
MPARRPPLTGGDERQHRRRAWARSGASETFGANVETNAQRAAKNIANQLKPFFASKGRIVVQ